MFTGTFRGLIGFSAVAVALALAGCGSSQHSGSPTTTGPATPTQAITDTFVKFFNGSAGTAQKVALLDNGSAYADAINAQVSSPMAKSTSATVGKVTTSGADHADVIFTILFNGKPALLNQPGSAVLRDGSWKVTDSTFCALLTLEGNPPAACAGVPPVPAAPPSKP